MKFIWAREDKIHAYGFDWQWHFKQSVSSRKVDDHYIFFKILQEKIAKSENFCLHFNRMSVNSAMHVGVPFIDSSQHKVKIRLCSIMAYRMYYIFTNAHTRAPVWTHQVTNRSLWVSLSKEKCSNLRLKLHSFFAVRRLTCEYHFHICDLAVRKRSGNWITCKWKARSLPNWQWPRFLRTYRHGCASVFCDSLQLLRRSEG